LLCGFFFFKSQSQSPSTLLLLKSTAAVAAQKPRLIPRLSIDAETERLLARLGISDSVTNDVSGTAPKMHRELYMAAKSGNTDFIKKKAEEDMERHSLAFQESPKSNTILHIAASSGHDQLVEAILESHHELALKKNYAGDLALHVATSAGHLPIVKKLASAELLQVKNNEGNTPLHLALINKYKEVVDRNLVLKNKYREIADFLVETEPEVSYYLNAEHKSPLYMAAEAGDAVLVQLMIEKASRSEPFEESKSIVHAAITGKNMGIEFLLATLVYFNFKLCPNIINMFLFIFIYFVNFKS
jgi:ankyrin repeat protein